MPLSRTRLYNLADELHRIAPWKWMREDQLIALKRFGSEELDHISIMGAAGNHRSLALYLGETGRHYFNLLQEGAHGDIPLAEEDNIALVLGCPQLQATYTNRGDLYPEELREIKAQQRKYRGENWPCFRSFRPGYAPYPVDDEEADRLADAIEQALVVAPDWVDEPFGDYRAGASGGMERITRAQGKDGAWTTTWSPDDMRLAAFAEPAPSQTLLATVAELPASGLEIECHFQMLPSPFGSRGSRAVFLHLAMSVDSASGFVFGVSPHTVEGRTHEALVASIPDVFLKQWIENDIRPASLAVSNAMSEAVLRVTAESLDIPLRRVSRLPQLDRALRSMSKAMGL